LGKYVIKPKYGANMELERSATADWDGMGWDGMGWDGMGWDGIHRKSNKANSIAVSHKILKNITTID